MELAGVGFPKQELAALLEGLLLELRGRGDRRQADEDAVLHVLDGLAGWRLAYSRLLPEMLDEWREKAQ